MGCDVGAGEWVQIPYVLSGRPHGMHARSAGCVSTTRDLAKNHQKWDAIEFFMEEFGFTVYGSV
jgi:hypothetical protein